MKLARLRTGGRDSWGLVSHDGQTLVEAPEALRSSGEEMVEVLTRLGAEELGRLFGHRPTAGVFPLGAVTLLPPVARPGRILCVGLNYRAHVDEVGREMPVHPSVFLRAADTLLGHGGEVPMPAVSECLDFEGELALVIGQGGTRIAEADALAHIAGYTCFNDVSVRDWQKHSVTAGKNFPSTAPCGPWLLTADAVGDPAHLELRTRLNGQEVQRDRVGSMVYPLATLISYLSNIAPLRCGDIIATGTPAGVGSGRTPKLWMRPGDVVEVEIDGIGVLSNTVGGR